MELSVIRSRVKVAPQTEYTPQEPLVQLVGGCHWKVRNTTILRLVLEARGYQQLDTEKPNELARLWKPQHGIVIIKTNGWAVARSGGFTDLAEIRKAGL